MSVKKKTTTMTKKAEKKTTMMSPSYTIGPKRLAHIFTGIDMRLSHTGLKELLKAKKIVMKEGDFIVFINTARTMVKAFASSLDAILFVKNGNQKLDLGVIKYLPRYCNGPTLNLAAAVENNLKDIMARRKT